jgi:hypothetical protein
MLWDERATGAREDGMTQNPPSVTARPATSGAARLRGVLAAALLIVCPGPPTALAQTNPQYTDVRVRVDHGQFSVDKKRTTGQRESGAKFLMFISYFDGMAAYDAGKLDEDLDYIAYTLGFDGIRVLPNWYRLDSAGCYVKDPVKALFTAHGSLQGDVPDGPGGRLLALLELVKRAQKRGLIVDVTFTRETVTGLDVAHYQTAVVRAAELLRPYRNVIIDLQNERDGFLGAAQRLDKDQTRAIRDAVRAIDVDRIVVASAGPGDAATVAKDAGLSAIAVHDSRDPTSQWYLDASVAHVVARMRAGAPGKPIYLQEPMPWSAGLTLCGKVEPSSKEADANPSHFRTAVAAAKTRGAAAWTFHTRQSFDLASQSLKSKITGNVTQKALLENIAGAGLASTTANTVSWPAQVDAEPSRLRRHPSPAPARIGTLALLNQALGPASESP